MFFKISKNCWLFPQTDWAKEHSHKTCGIVSIAKQLCLGQNLFRVKLWSYKVERTGRRLCKTSQLKSISLLSNPFNCVRIQVEGDIGNLSLGRQFSIHFAYSNLWLITFSFTLQTGVFLAHSTIFLKCNGIISAFGLLLSHFTMNLNGTDSQNLIKMWHLCTEDDKRQQMFE